MRRSIHLNYGWKFVSDFSGDNPLNPELFQQSIVVDIPHTIKEIPFNHFDESIYQMQAVYKKNITIDNFKFGEHGYLKFGAVMNVCQVFLNNQLLGHHEGGYTPFSFDISNYLQPDVMNELEIVLLVDSHEVKDVPPFGNVVDYLGYGGIYREVEIEILPAIFIEDITIKTRESLRLQEDEMTLDFNLKLNSNQLKTAKIIIEILDEDKVVFSHTYHDVNTSISKQETHTPIERWSIDHPKLYLFKATLYSKKEKIDEVFIQFGYRDAKFTTEGFILNNKLIKLIGLNRHQSYPYVGYAMPKRMQESDAMILKHEFGCNIVRCSHYMQSDHFIRKCDEIGLLVFEEIPGWQYIGDDSFKERSYQNLKEMVKHHKNHPSIVIWGTRINESPDDHDFYQKLSELAIELDDSRQTGGVRNFAGSELLEDVYTYNDFSHIGNNSGLENPIKIARGIVPYLVTEHNGHIFPTKKFDPEMKRAEQALRHLSVLESLHKYKSISGAIGWCMADYNTHKDFGSGDRICYHGVSDMFRIPKYAASTYASQQDDFPVLEVLSNMNIGEYPRSVISDVVIMSNCDFIKIYHDDRLINTYYSDWQLYPNIKHAPFIIDDFIGARLEEDSGYSKRIAKRIKKVLLSFNLHGMALPFIDKMRMANLMIFHQFTIGKAMDIYGKYLGNWGKEASVYRFDGYINNELVISKTKGQTKKFSLFAKADTNILQHDITYDVTRIVVKLVDEYDNVYPYAVNVINVQTTDEVEVIGPKSVALSAGSIGFYIKTKKKGKANVTLSSPGFKAINIQFEIN